MSDANRGVGGFQGEIWPALLPIVLFWGLAFPALNGWWVGDDPCHLSSIAEIGILQLVLEGQGVYFTPWLHVSLGLDWILFGLRPAAYYWHHLLSFTVFLVASYAALRLFTTRWFCCLALLPLAVSPMAQTTARALSNRHYVEGMLFLAAGFLATAMSMRQRKTTWAIVGSLFFLLSMSAKEVFVPLCVVLPCLLVTRRRDWKFLVPSALAFVLYIFMRLLSLGRSNMFVSIATGGDSGVGSLGSTVLEQIGLANRWLGPSFPVVFLLVFFCMSLRSRRFAITLLLIGIATLIPLFPIADQLASRHLWLPFSFTWCGLAFAASWCSRHPARWARFATWGLVIWMVLTATVSTTAFVRDHRREARIRHYQAEGRFVLESERGGSLLTNLPDISYLECIERLRRIALIDNEGPGYCGDACLCATVYSQLPVWQYHEGQIRQITSQVDPSCAVDRPLDLSFVSEAGNRRISWELGPYGDGEFAANLISREDKPSASIPIPLARQGTMPFRLYRPLRFVVSYRSPQGWTTYSDPQLLVAGGTVDWQRVGGE